MKSITNPYESPAIGESPIRESLWLPLRTIGAGLALFGIVVAIGAASAEPIVLAIVGLAILGPGILVHRRRRLLVVDRSELRVVRSGVAGAPFEASAIVRHDHHPGITAVYGLIMLGIVSSSFKAAALPGGFVERVTAAWVGPYIGAICAVAIWRRLVCMRVTVPGERRSLWIHADHATNLGIRDPA